MVWYVTGGTVVMLHTHYLSISDDAHLTSNVEFYIDLSMYYFVTVLLLLLSLLLQLV